MLKRLRLMILMVTCALPLWGQQAGVAQAEYFWDSPVAPGSGIPIQAADFLFDHVVESIAQGSIPLPASNGAHTFNLRVQDQKGDWGPVHSVVVHRRSNSSLVRNAEIAMAEFYLDNDPGPGAATAIMALDGNLDEAVEGLLANGLLLPGSAGPHIFGLRVKGDDGIWSQTFQTAIHGRLNTPLARSIQVAEAEYFWDADPGQGAGVPILAFDGNFDETVESILGSPINLPAASGPHSFNLRVKDADNQWGPLFSTTVFRRNGTTQLRDSRIIQAEYFFDVDPGQGAANVLLALDGNLDETVEELLQSGIILPSQRGPHSFNLRVRGSDSTWSALFTTVVYRDSVEQNARPMNVVQGEYYWNSDPGPGNGSPIVALDGNFDNAVEVALANATVSGLPPGANALYLRVKGRDNAWGPSFGQVIATSAPAFYADTLTGPKAFCGAVPASAVAYAADTVAGGVYFWDAVGGTVQSGQGSDQVQILWNASGPYQVILQGCQGAVCDTLHLDVVVNPLPQVEAGAGQSICPTASASLSATSPDAPLTYLWSPTSGLSSASVPNPTASPSTTTEYLVTVTDSNGCSATDSLTIVVHPQPIADAGPDTLICSGDTAQLNGSGGLAFAWTPSASLSNPTVPNPIAFPATSTDYTLSVTDLNGCTDTDQMTVIVSGGPAVNAGTDQQICIGQAAQLNATGALSYVWTPAASLSDPGLPNPIATPPTTTTYTVTGTDANTCTNSDQVTVTVNPLPVPVLSGDADICIGASMQLSASGGNSYFWAPAAGLSNPNAASPNASPSQTTTYTVTVTSAFGCEALDSLTVTVHPLPNVSAGNDTLICAGDTLQLAGSGADVYLWSPSAFLDDPSLASPSAFPIFNTDFYLQGTDLNGCVNHDTVQVEVQICVSQSLDRNLVMAEYFWDSDPGPGLGTAIAAADGNFDETVESILQGGIQMPITTGPHVFGLRVQDTDGNWGPVFRTLVERRALTGFHRDVRVAMAEYFWDADPGPGAGRPMPVFDGNFGESLETLLNDTASLPQAGGLHRFSVRVKGADGAWGPPFSTVLNYDPVGSILRPLYVKQAEYYWDVDPGQGAGTAMLAFDGNLDQSVEALLNNPVNLPAAQGPHVFGLRVRGADNSWGPVFQTLVVRDTITSTVRPVHVAMAEYFFDVEPAPGSGTPMLAFDGNLDESVESLLNNPINLPNTLGPHVFGVRVKDADNDWGPVFRTIVQRDSLTTTVRPVEVTEAEYFWNVDPGQGLGTPMLAFDGNFDSPVEALLNNPINLPGNVGQHVFGVRVKDADHAWGPVFRVIVVRDSVTVGTRTVRVTQAEYYFDVSPAQGFGTPILAQDGNFDEPVEALLGNLSNLPLAPGPHIFGIRVKDADGNWSPDFRTIVVQDTMEADLRAMRVVQGEYFFNADPGPGSGQPILALDGNFNDAAEATFANINVTTLPPGLNLFSVRVKGEDNVWGPVFSTVLVIDSNLFVTPDTIYGPNAYCGSVPAGPVLYTADTISQYTYTWLVTNGTIDTGQGNDSVTVTWGPAGPYLIALEACDGSFCDTVFQPVTVFPSPSANAGADVDICQGGSTQLFASGGVAYLWTPSTGLNDDDIPNPIASPSVTTVYTVAVFDNNGCYGTDQVTVTVLPPAAANAGPDQSICPGDTAQLQGSGGLSYAWTPAATLSDPAIANPLAFPAVTTTYTLTVFNAQGCVGTDQVTVYMDNQPPAIACPSNLMVSNDPGQCSAQASYVSPVGVDNCPGSATIQVLGLASGSSFPVGTTLNRFRVTDGGGLRDSCSFTVTVNDAEAPSISCPASAAVSNDPGQCSAVFSYASATALDNCPGASVSLQSGLASGSAFPLGQNTVTFRATDASGNIASCSFAVTVTDTEAPTITCPANIIRFTDPGQCSAQVSYSVAAADNCPGFSLSQTAGLSSGAIFPVGTTLNSFALTDGSGNVADCSFSVTVQDSQAPQIACPASIVVNNDPGNCSAVVAYASATAGDNCPSTTVSLLSGLGSGASFPLGTSTETFQAQDASGNSAVCSFSIQVIDAEDPAITCPANVFVLSDTALCGAMVNYAPPTGMDNCPGAVTSLVSPLGSGDVFPVGLNTVVYVVTDGAGRTDTCTFQVEVDDSIAPTLICPGPITVVAANNFCSRLVNYTVIAYDNCAGDSLIQTAGLGSGVVFPVGVTTESYFLLDANGNSDTCSFAVTVLDQQAPVVTCPSNIIANNSSGQCGSQVNYAVQIGLDNCGVPALTQISGFPSGTFFPGGLTVNTFVLSDISGNADTCSFTVLINDVEAPAIACPSSVVVPADSGSCTALVSYQLPAATDNCPGVTTVLLSGLPPGSTFPAGTSQVYYQASDTSGNTTDCNFSITVQDSEIPQISCPANLVVSNDSGQCGAVVSYAVPAGTDNCAGAITSQTAGLGSGQIFPIGTTTETYTVTDASNNSASCSFSITVNDTEFPAIVCPASVNLNTNPGFCSAVYSFSLPSYSDNCPNPVLAQVAGLSSGASFPLGQTTQTFQVTDGSGNVAPCSFTVTVVDNQGPALSCPSNISLSNDQGQCGAVVTYASPSATDNCSSTATNLIAGQVSGSFFPVGFTTNTFQATDSSGNSSTCSFSVHVVDGESPVLTCPSVVLRYADGNACGTVVTYTPPFVTDNCPNPSLNLIGGLSSGSFFGVGSHTVTYQASDAAQLMVNCSFTVLVSDTVSPSITCPADTVLSSSGGGCGSVYAYPFPQATDNCPSPNTVLLSGLASGSTFPVGSTTVVFQVLDNSGNDASCSFVVTVQDNSTPSITCPASIVRSNDLNVCGALVNYTTPQGTDNCSSASTQQVSGLASGATFPVGVTVNTFVVTDSSGHTDTCSFSVTVNDNQNPSLVCPSDLYINVDSGLCEALVTFIPPIGTDNCPGAVTLQSSGFLSGSLFPIGVSTVGYQAMDASGNTANCSFEVTVIDNDLPEIVCPANIMLNNDPGQCGAVVNYATPVGTDNCPGAVTVQTSGQASGAFVTRGSHTQTFVVTDAFSNSASCSFLVTVLDNEAPVINCPASIVVNANPGGCGTNVSFAQPSISDNCPGVGLVQTAGQGSGSFFGVGTVVQSFQVTDNSGNQAACSFNITVQDNEQPTITCPANLVRGNDANVCGALVNYTAPVGTDNCSAANTIQVTGLGSGSIFPIGTTVETYVVSDTAGNSDTCTFSITVNDVQAPSIQCPNFIAINAAPGQCTAVATYLPPVGTDNCPGAVTVQILGLGTGASFPIGNTIERFRVTDAAGNQDTCQFVVQVIDNEQPLINCPADTLLGNSPGICGAVFSFAAPVGTDNCPGAVTTQTGGIASGQVFPVGTTQQTFTVSDAFSNTASCSFNVTVADTQAPQINCPASTILNSNSGGCGAAFSFVAPMGTDNCPGSVTVQTSGQGSGSLFSVGVTTQSYLVTDAAGHQSSCSFTVTVIDNTTPTISCPASLVQVNDLNVCGAIVTYTTPQGVDNCTVANTSQTGGLASGALFPVGLTLNTFVVADGSGNADTCSFTVTVNDVELPRIICPANISLNVSSGNCEALVAFAPPVGTDNCPGVSTVQSAGLPSNSLFPVGLTIQTFRAVDAYGNVDSCSFAVTVIDNEVPQISCPADTVIGNDLNSCGAVYVYPTPVGTDNCPSAATIRSQGLASGAFFPIGTTQQTFVVTDPYNNSASCSFNVTVADTQRPVINCQANPTVNSDPGGCGAVVAYLTPSGSDNCPGAATAQSAGLGAGAFFSVGQTLETYLVTDAAGNKDSCSILVTVIDNLVPNINCPANISVNNDPNVCGALVNYPAPVGTDNCAAATTTQVAGLGPGAVFPIGVTGETWQVTDSSGNADVCSFSITVIDVQKPTLTCPANILVPVDSGFCSAVVNYSLGLFDNCPGLASSVLLGLPSGSAFPVGSTLVRYLASDIHGNVDSCQFTVTVNDGQPPVLTCPADTVLNNDPGICGAVLNYLQPSVTDNCPGAVISPSIFNLGSGSTFPVGIRTEAFTAADASGNSASCSFTVTVIDAEAPVINCQAGFTLPADLGNCGATVSYNVPLGTDNCANPVTVLAGGIGNGGFFPVGVTTEVYTVTDNSGNTASCAIVVTILDQEEPGIVCPPNVVINNDPGQCGAVYVYAPPVGLDNCSGAFTYQSAGLGSGAVYPVGTTAERYVVVDSSGNDDSCSFTVTVLDGEIPTISCPANITLLSDPGQCTAQVSYATPMGMDNCAGAVTLQTLGLGSGSTFPVGVTLERYIVTDSFGNRDSCSFLVTVVDSSAPVLTCPADVLLANDPGYCGALLNYAAPQVMDNCPGAAVSQLFGQSAGTLFPVGSTSNVFVASDTYGNADTCSFVVTVQDTEAPVIVCQASFTLPGDTGLCGRVVNYFPAVGTDNCPGALTALVTGLGNGNFFPAGTTEERYVVTDAHGNRDSCSIFVTILDAEGPSLNCPADTTLVNDPGQCGATFVYSQPQGNDNCSIVAIGQSSGLPSGSLFPIGGTANTWVASDSTSNADSCSFIVTVIDAEAPALSCPGNITVYAGPSQCGLPVNFLVTATDNCPGVTTALVLGLSSGSTFPSGSTPVEFTATDASGNSSTCSFTVDVVDTIVPAISCPPTIAVSNDPGICGATVNYAAPTATDNCPGLTISGSIFNLGSGSVFPVGQTYETFTVTDASGNASDCTLLIRVEDTEAPVINCQAGFTLPSDPGNCGAMVNFTTPVGTDNCANPTTVLSSGIGSGGFFPVGTTTSVYTVSDASGQTASCSISIVVEDQEIPGILCPGSQVLSNGPGQCGAVYNYAAVTATDNCGPATVAQTGGLASGQLFPIGTTLNSFVASDSSGNTANCSFTVTVNDIENPSIACPADDTLFTAPGDTFALASYSLPVATDNCPGVALSLVSGPASGGSFLLGTTTVIYQATDAAGNTASCSFSITVVGQSGLPSIVCPNDTVVVNDPGNCSAQVAYIAPVGVDHEPGAVTFLLSGLGPNGNFPLGLSQEVYVVTDTSGNSDTCTFSITVIDAEGPTINCPANMVQTTDPGQCSAVVTFAIPAGTDNCPGAVTSQVLGLPSGSTFPGGSTQQSFLVVDGAGNRDSCEFTVTVTDAMPPSVVCPASISVATDPGTCDALVSFPPVNVSDNCGSATLVQTAGLPSGSAFPLGTTLQTFVATDTSGNSNSCAFVVTVSDQDPPTLYCPASFTVNNDSGLCGARFVHSAPNYSDNCAGTTLMQTGGLAPGAFFPIGPTSIAWLATDTAGNTGTCSYTVTVVDAERPVLNCPPDITVTNNSSLCGAEESYIPITATDNCNLAGPVVQIGGLPPGGFFLVGVTVNTFTVSDFAGNADTCSFNFIVVDTSGPEIACPANISIVLGPGYSGDTVHYLPPLGSDQCPGAFTSLVSGLGTGAYFPVGTTNEVYVVTDLSGNTDTCSFSVTVNSSADSIPPMISCPANIVVSNDPGQCGAVVSYSPPVGTDDQPGASTVLTGGLGSGAYFSTGAHTETYTVFDQAGNYSSCSFTVTVLDVEAPVVTCPANMTVGNNPGICGATVYFNPQAYDNCQLASINYTYPPGTLLGPGTVANTITAADIYGNVGQCTFNITVLDTQPPVANCRNRNINLNASGFVVLNPLLINNLSTDNCALSISLSQDTFFCSDLGNNSVWLYAIDPAGNVDSCMARVRVRDRVNPLADCKNITVVLDSNGAATISPADVDAGSFDNCGMTLSLDHNTFSCADVGTVNAADLIISEYVEGASRRRYLEIFNGTGQTVNLGNYQVRRYNNGSATATNIFNLSGSLPSGQTLVLRNMAVTGTGIPANNVMQFTGDDALALYNTQSNSLVDIFGVIGEDPGNAWTGAGGYTTVNRTLRRNPFVGAGVNVNPQLGNGPAGFTTLTTEWEVRALNDTSGLGSHALAAGPGNVVLLYATDGSGNRDSCTAVVQVLDQSPPQLTCPPDTALSAGNQFSVQVNYVLPSATDNCSATVSLVSGIGSGGSFGIGTHEEHYEAVDPSGNGVSCLFRVEVLGSADGRVNPAAVSAGAADQGLNLAVYPNPFSSRVTFQLDLEEATAVHLTISSAEGKVLYEITTEALAAGTQRLFWDGKDGSGKAQASGLYIYRLQAGGYTEFGRVEYLRD